MLEIFSAIHSAIIQFEMVLCVAGFLSLAVGTLTVLGYELGTKRKA